MSNGGTHPHPHDPARANSTLTQAGSDASDASDEEVGAYPPDLPTDVPTPARVYGLLLGGKDNFAVDREMAGRVVPEFPEFVDIGRENRRFLYRAVRFLAREAGIRQFLDLGSGLPTERNVHQVAQEFQPGARVVYVDNDPIVLAHGRALLNADDRTTIITADMTQPEEILEHEDTRRLIDFAEPVAVLMFSIPHLIPDDAAALRAIREPLARAVPGSFLALSHVVADDEVTRRETTELITSFGMPWKTRAPTDVDAWIDALGLEAVEPGLGDINDWRPDPNQPALSPPNPVVHRFLGASQQRKRVFEYGGVLRLPQAPASAGPVGGRA